MGLTIPTVVLGVLFFASHAGSAFDSAFVPLIVGTVVVGVALALVQSTRSIGHGVVAGAALSFGVVVGLLLAVFFVGGGS